MTVPIDIGKGQFLYHVPVLRCVLVRRQLDAVCDEYIARADGLAREKRMQRLFLHIIHCARADAYELYTEILKGATLAAKSLDCPEPHTLSLLTERIALHHAAVFAQEEGSGFTQEELLRAAKRVFTLDAAAENELHCYMEKSGESLAAFRAAYAGDFAGRLLRGQENVPAPVTLAFTCGFFDRSYDGFMKSLSKYVPFGGGGNGGKIYKRAASGD